MNKCSLNASCSCGNSSEEDIRLARFEAKAVEPVGPVAPLVAVGRGSNDL